MKHHKTAIIHLSFTEPWWTSYEQGSTTAIQQFLEEALRAGELPGTALPFPVDTYIHYRVARFSENSLRETPTRP